MAPTTDPLILVPLDTSPLSERSLPTAMELARRFAAQVHLLVVVDGPVAHNIGDKINDDNALADNADAYLQRIAAEHATEGVDITWSCPFAVNAAESITENARELGADLVVITSHGRSGFSRLLAGSVAEEVLRASTVPVVAVPATSSKD